MGLLCISNRFNPQFISVISSVYSSLKPLPTFTVEDFASFFSQNIISQIVYFWLVVAMCPGEKTCAFTTLANVSPGILSNITACVSVQRNLHPANSTVISSVFLCCLASHNKLL